MELCQTWQMQWDCRKVMVGAGCLKKENKLKSYLRKNLYLDTTVSINDNREVIVENCNKILEYNDIFIKISTSTVTFQIWGNNLAIKNYEDKGLIIQGVISSVEFI